jgi:hypothetical protein
VAAAGPGRFDGPVIPPDWMPHRRPTDSELVGYTVTTAAGTTPLCLLGLPLAPAGAPAEAVRVLEARGLACLAEPWWLTSGEEAIEVRILEAHPDRVRVVEAPFGIYGPDSPRHTLETPTTALSSRP